MFTLAAHEIQSTTTEKELHCGNHLRPSNIRIHGTMYRRVFSAAETTPLRYLVVDPAERARQGKQHGLDATILRHLEQELLPHNPHMLHIRAALPGRKRSQEATLALRWDEGINEAAAVVQHEPAAQSRAVLFHMNAASARQAIEFQAKHMVAMIDKCFLQVDNVQVPMEAGKNAWSAKSTALGQRVRIVREGTKIAGGQWKRAQLINFLIKAPGDVPKAALKTIKDFAEKNSGVVTFTHGEQ